jgi:hypothetical protein
VAGRVDDVDVAVLAVPLDRRALGEDGDPALLLEVVRIHRPLLDALVVAEGAGLAEQLVDEGRLAVIDVGDDRHVAEAHGDNARFSGPQGSWLAERNACRSAVCIAEAYDQRFREMLGEIAVLPIQFERSGRPGSLAMMALGQGWHLFELSAQYVYPSHDNVNTGGAAGAVRIEGGRGHWRRRLAGAEEDRILDFMSGRSGWSVREQGFCGNGLHVFMSGLYRPLPRPRARRR